MSDKYEALKESLKTLSDPDSKAIFLQSFIANNGPIPNEHRQDIVDILWGKSDDRLWEKK